MQLEPPHGIGCNHALLEAAYIRFPLSLVRFEWPAASPEGKKQTGQAKCSLHLHLHWHRHKRPSAGTLQTPAVCQASHCAHSSSFNSTITKSSFTVLTFNTSFSASGSVMLTLTSQGRILPAPGSWSYLHGSGRKLTAVF